MRDRYDATFNGKKPRNVKQSEIDDHVVEAHGPDSTPRRNNHQAVTTSDVESHADFAWFNHDEDFGDEEADYYLNYEVPASTPPASTPFAEIVKKTYAATG